MKKCTSILMLVLMMSAAILMSSCSDCDGGVTASEATVLKQSIIKEIRDSLGVTASEILAISSTGDKLKIQIKQDENGNLTFWDAVTGKQLLAKGEKGDKGDKGDTGATGATGEKGDKGDKGDTGATGPAGADGANGADGKSAYQIAVEGGYSGTEAEWIASLKGATGAAGADGKSAYQIAVEGGYIGTEAEWLASLKGEKGDKGDKGDTGDTGTLDSNGVYVTYDDGGTTKTIYIPKVSEDASNIYITVGGTKYTLPKNGGGSTCTWTLTQDPTTKKWTVSDGKGNSVEIPIWINNIEVKYDATTGKFTLTSGTNSVEVPTDYAVVTENADGTATVASKNGSASIKIQQTQPVVSSTNSGNTVRVINYDLSGNPIDTLYMPSQGAYSATTLLVGNIDERLDTVENNLGTWDPTAHDGKTISEYVDEIQSDVNDLSAKVSSMIREVYNALAAMITNIQIEEVSTNAIGSYSGVLTNLKTTKLITYFGTTDEMLFPSVDPLFYKAAGDPAILASDNNAGTIQLTINPLETDFTGVKLALVNSVGDTSSIQLSPVQKSDKTLMTGITRAGESGLYYTNAYISPDDATNESKLHISVDKSAVKAALKDIINKKQNVDRVTVNKVLNALNSVVTGISTERLGVQASYTYETTDEITGEKITSTKTVRSPMDLSGIAVKPLGFESLPEKYRDSLRVFNRAKKMVKKINDKFAKKFKNYVEKEFKLSNLQEQISELQIKITKIKPIPDSMKVIKKVVDIDTTVTVNVPVDMAVPINIDKDIEVSIPVNVEYTYQLPKNFRIVGGKIVYDETTATGTATGKAEKTVEFVYNGEAKIDTTISSDVDFWITREFAIDISDMVDNVNNTISLVQDLDKLCNSAQDIISNIYNIEDKISEGAYLNRIYKYIDKMSAKSARGLYHLFLPAMLVNSDKGLSLGGIEALPTEVSGTVEVIPTTYSNGLVAPVFKKYIRVNGGTGYLLGDNEVKVDITSQLKSGLNVVEYYALDYYGNEMSETYYIKK